MRRFLIILAPMFVFAWASLVPAVAAARPAATSKPADRYDPDVPTTRPDVSKVPRRLTPWNGVDAKAVELVKGVYAKEDWIHHVKRFYIQASQSIRNTQEGTDFFNHLFREQDRPSAGRTIQYEFAFDDHRFRYAEKMMTPSDGGRRVYTWDGKLQRRYEYNPGNKREGYALYPTMEGVAHAFNYGLLWPRARVHYFWFYPRDTKQDYYTINGNHFYNHPASRLVSEPHHDCCRRRFRPEDFHVMGVQEYRGIRCYVLEQRPAYDDWRWYVGVETGFLHGKMSGNALRLFNHEVDPRHFEVWAALGYPAKSHKGLWEKQRHLTRLEYDELKKRYVAELSRRGFETEQALGNTTGVPEHEEWFMDYKEVAPGRFWPMRLGDFAYSMNDRGRVVVRSMNEVKVQRIEVDGGLRDDLFTIDMEEGLPVMDYRYDPFVGYRYRSGMPDEETLAAWRESEKYRQRRQEEAAILQRKAALDGMIGKPAPELPRGKWFNTKPLTWNDLRGQTVIVQFAFLCEQDDRQDIDHKDRELLTALYDRRARTGLSIISIHPCRVRDAKMRAFVRAEDRQYPICIDEPPLNDENDGATFERYRIACGPFAFVVGPDGKVVRYGLLADLPEVGAYCEKLPPLPSLDRSTDGSSQE